MSVFPMCKYITKRCTTQIKKVVSYFFYSMLLLRKPIRPITDPLENSVAVVFLASIGDFVVFCDAARKMRESGKSITIICKSGNGTAEFAKITGLFDKVIEVKTSGIHRFANMRLLSRLEFDTVFCAPLGRHSLPDIYACAIRANNRFFPNTLLDCSLPSIKKRIDKWADKLITVREIQELKRYAEFLRDCGFSSYDVTPFHLKNLTRPKTSTLAIFPGAGGGAGKCWEHEKYAYVARKLIEKNLISKVFILGEKGDAVCCEALYRELCQFCKTENLCGKTGISDLIDIIMGCCLTLANDSGGAHISIACGAPTVIVCGMWQYGRFYPNPLLENCYSAVIEESFCQSCDSSFPLCGKVPAPCVSQVDRDTVLQRAESILKEIERT